MTVFDFLSLICGLALFLFGMEVMSDNMKKSAGKRLKSIMEKMTAGPVRGFLLGTAVTALMQSSSATTVMVVGFVNSGTMTLSQSVGVIMGANVGAGITAWITGLSGIGAAAGATAALQWLKPMSWMPILALVGMALLMFSKHGTRRGIGNIFMGFAVLMVGMELMSSSVAGLSDNEAFCRLLTAFDNPLLGLFAGVLVTALIQSSGASVGILQSLTASGVITFGTAIPIVMGQNIGTCITALLSSAGAGKNGKRAALIHLYYNVISAAFFLVLFVILKAVFPFAFLERIVGPIGIAVIHTIFKLLSVVLFVPFTHQLEKLATVSVRGEDNTPSQLLDERLFRTPAIAVKRASQVTAEMEDVSLSAMKQSLSLLDEFDVKLAESIMGMEEQADRYEDALGTYLVKINSRELSEEDAREVTRLLHVIGDFERISDHAANLVESGEEIRDKKIVFSAGAAHELQVLTAALKDILERTHRAYQDNDPAEAAAVEPLEQVIDGLCTTIRGNHISRLQTNECTIENGFVLSDILTNCERVSDHCSNIAGLVIEMAKFNALNMHEYLRGVKAGEHDFEAMYRIDKEKYTL